MSKQLIVKPEKCVSCRTCELMCSFGHTGEFNPSMSSVKVIGEKDDSSATPFMCTHCAEAFCMDACPAGAISRDENGAVVINADECTLCEVCVDACPNTFIHISPKSDKMVKCDLCGGDPQCVKFCPTAAIVYENGKEA